MIGLNDAISAESYFRIFLQTLKTVMNKFTDMMEQTDDTLETAEAIVQALAKCDFKRGNKYEDDLFLEKEQFAGILRYLAETACKLKEHIAKYENVKTEWNIKPGEDKDILVATAEVWTFTGLLQVMLFGNLELIDPVTKKELKLQYNSEEMEETENMVYAQELQSYIISNKGLDESDKHNLHPRVIMQSSHLKQLIVKQEELRKCVAARPDPPQFHLLASSLANSELVINMQKRIVQLINKLDESDYNDVERLELIKSAEEVLSEEKNWEESQMLFCEKFNKYSSWYPDMALPLISAATMVSIDYME
ncbi:hypothetical protein C0J52_08700 [Blattella germanica]|nr:hypothetical protein C0J52_08700 [Blattella germanica]